MISHLIIMLTKDSKGRPSIHPIPAGLTGARHQITNRIFRMMDRSLGPNTTCFERSFCRFKNKRKKAGEWIDDDNIITHSRRRTTHLSETNLQTTRNSLLNTSTFSYKKCTLRYILREDYTFSSILKSNELD